MHNNNTFSNIDQTFIISDVVGKKYLLMILFSNEASFYQTFGYKGTYSRVSIIRHDVDGTYLG